MQEADSELQQLFEQARSVAVVGIKDLESEDAYRIPQYLQAHGYRIVPVNPKLDDVLGQPAHASLRDVDEPIDIVNLFRAAEHIPHHVDEILAMDPAPKAAWMQLGIHHGDAAARLRAAGITVVQDRCIMVEHRRLIEATAADRERERE
ncbi:MAG: CoA-binding protein [Myxococcota bacterium]|nr:CoA-binding protein [Myxococcota bacterium]